MAKTIKKTGLFDDLKPEEKEATTHTDVHTDTHTYNDSDVYEPEVKVKETKTKRIQILTYSKIVRRMDSYGKRHGLSRAEVFEQAVTEFLEKHS